MKQFQFTLEKVRRFRGAQQRAEEARQSMLLSSAASIEARMEELQSAHLAQRKQISEGQVLDGMQLETLHHFGEFVGVEVTRLSRELALLRKEIQAQAVRVAECKQRVELLSKLKDKERSRWELEAAKELQLAAEESFTARLLRDSRGRK